MYIFNLIAMVTKTSNYYKLLYCMLLRLRHINGRHPARTMLLAGYMSQLWETFQLNRSSVSFCVIQWLYK